ncbi:STAS domain-containing protein [Nonomuraea sp. 3-1Str]|uniref:STAS domain-containing protein n=1 Tax=unclassified Nonomuraea TaxID=2593643 RepID=UPI0028624A30|nr:STAS domain-containing protein [Nonomuraea sp. 3-1Str]MDR8412578.1 STAS domain-containing protein [Nonomuraea sp. 3-1Str]
MERAGARRAGFSWTTDRNDGVTVIALAGELDIATAGELRQAVGDAVSGGPDGPPLLVIDMLAVDFCDSTGLSVLVSAINGAAAAGGRAVLSGIGPRMARLLHVTGLDKRFQTYGTVDDAVQALRTP